ncbi:hypothetical protein CAPTEDRAFT_223537 [Capitella teleta]|uniref:Uncharacterized protein n=1 Tax=Capitella teleta TaxID=283909 RepID=R7TEU5_CAPTE|nr:hypothetical protein CAPTEDRAFT_223537 [Capitella teleta]|eukprot:ELT92249.1 hypothetical protein CAPTEDRAFT_223537 [Capitella teleta]
MKLSVIVWALYLVVVTAKPLKKKDADGFLEQVDNFGTELGNILKDLLDEADGTESGEDAIPIERREESTPILVPGGLPPFPLGSGEEPIPLGSDEETMPVLEPGGLPPFPLGSGEESIPLGSGEEILPVLGQGELPPFPLGSGEEPIPLGRLPPFPLGSGEEPIPLGSGEETMPVLGPGGLPPFSLGSGEEPIPLGSGDLLSSEELLSGSENLLRELELEIMALEIGEALGEALPCDECLENPASGLMPSIDVNE